MVEEGILEREVTSKGLDIEGSSARMVSYKKLGSYGSGEVRILGDLTDEGLKKINDNKNNGSSVLTNRIINYTCSFEYSYKTGNYTWVSDYPC